MFQLILRDRGLATLQVMKSLMDNLRISLNDAMQLVHQDNSILYETDNEQDALSLKEKVESFGATTEIVSS